MKVVYVRESKTRGYTVLGLNSGEGAVAYTVPSALYSSIGSPLASEVVDDGFFDEIALADEVFRAGKKALSLLAFADNNKKALYSKLIRAGFSKDAAREAVLDMLRLGYINEEKQLERLILTEANVKLTGARKFVPKLLAKGFDRNAVESVLQRLVDEGQIDFEKIKRTLLEKKLGANPTDEDLRALLYKSGF